ncbi:MAG: hypothetical protein M1826_000899 [Phylliscum demangeonii]|nr:MAG: hypothetical protein M1826_000899 [Phylliscum demangeonii]
MAAYNQAHLDALDALSKLHAFEKKVALAGHPPTPNDEAHHRALRGDYDEKQKLWTRARDSRPLDRQYQDTGAGTQRAKSPETRPGSAEQASPAKEDRSTRHQPLQISGPLHLLAPVLSSASHLVHNLGRQWRATPWARYLTQPRVDQNVVKPVELLRAEHALP